MGTGKKEAARRERQGKADDGMGNVRTKGENFYRYVDGERQVLNTWAWLMTMTQICKEGQDLEHVQERQSTAQRRRKCHQSCLVPVERTTQSKNRTQSEVVREHESYLTRRLGLLSTGCRGTSVRSVSGVVEDE